MDGQREEISKIEGVSISHSHELPVAVLEPGAGPASETWTETDALFMLVDVLVDDPTIRPAILERRFPGFLPTDWYTQSRAQQRAYLESTKQRFASAAAIKQASQTGKIECWCTMYRYCAYHTERFRRGQTTAQRAESTAVEKAAAYEAAVASSGKPEEPPKETVVWLHIPSAIRHEAVLGALNGVISEAGGHARSTRRGLRSRAERTIRRIVEQLQSGRLEAIHRPVPSEVATVFGATSWLDAGIPTEISTFAQLHIAELQPPKCDKCNCVPKSAFEDYLALSPTGYAALDIAAYNDICDHYNGRDSIQRDDAIYNGASEPLNYPERVNGVLPEQRCYHYATIVLRSGDKELTLNAYLVARLRADARDAAQAAYNKQLQWVREQQQWLKESDRPWTQAYAARQAAIPKEPSRPGRKEISRKRGGRARRS